jgi:hypothetical protein
VLLHAMLGLDAETGGILGLVSGRVWTRHGRVTIRHQDRPLSEKEAKTIEVSLVEVTGVAPRPTPSRSCGSC